MNVREVIEALSAIDPDTEVVVRGYEGGVNTVVQVQPENIYFGYYPKDEWWYGQHLVADEADSKRWNFMNAVELVGDRVPEGDPK